MRKARKLLLVVDDEKPLAHALELKLEHEGYSAISVDSGMEALRLMRREKFDLLLLDLVMATTDGFQVLERMKQEHIKLPTIVLSNLNAPEDLDRVRAYGVLDYLVKAETSIHDVIQKVKDVLKH
jgi:two-component system alkaline phosphatase synthesis response regulator PhoP